MSKGFTLIEILFVVIILSALIGFSVPQLRNSYYSLQLNSFSKDLQSYMNYLSEQAVVQGETISLTIGNKKYWATIISDKSKLKTTSIPENIKLETEQKDVFFYPDGSIDAVTLKISNESNQCVSLTTKGVLGSVKMQNQE